MPLIQHVDSELVIVDQPHRGLGRLLLWTGGSEAICLFLVLWLVWSLSRKVPPTAGRSMAFTLFVVLGAATAIPLILAGWAMKTGQTRATFSRRSGSLSIERRWFGTRRDLTEFPISAVKSARVVTGRGSWRLDAVLESGTAVELTNNTDQRSDFAAAQAINEFLSTAPAEPAHPLP